MDNPTLQLIILALATYRLSSLFVTEPGVFNIFQRIRDWAGVNPAFSAEDQPNVLAGALSCVWCFSVWVGLALTVYHYFYPLQVTWLCLPFALSAVAIYLHEAINQK